MLCAAWHINMMFSAQHHAICCMVRRKAPRWLLQSTIVAAAALNSVKRSSTAHRLVAWSYFMRIM
jgi:hypothetical protein